MLLVACEQEEKPQPTAARVLASNGTQADVQAKVDQAVDGDTVTLPAGTFSWSKHVQVNKGITVAGQTAVNSDTGVCDDKTILKDDLTDPGLGEGFFHSTLPANKAYRLTGITFTKGTRTTNMYNGTVKVGGDSRLVRIDHLHLTGGLKQSNGIAIYGNVRGVADHIVIDQIDGQNLQNRAFNGAGAGDYGDETFAQPSGYGSDDFFFFEDMYIDNRNKPHSAGGGWDTNTAGRLCVRYSQLWDAELVGHGTEGGREHGGRAYLINNNRYHWDYYAGLDGIRSGTLIAHDNTFDGIKPKGYGMQTYRMMYNYGSGIWHGADGQNGWDLNVTEADGTNVPGHPPFLFDSGTVSAVGPGYNGSITDSTKNWPADKWSGYELRNATNGDTWLIDANTNNVLQIHTWGDSANHQAWTVGNRYEIRKVVMAIDQPGTGGGDVMTGANPTPKWPNRVREGCYSWNNVFTPDGSKINFQPSTPNLKEGRDYFSDTRLPGYTPYTYPHPLVTGGGPTPQPTGTPAPSATVPPPTASPAPSTPSGVLPAPSNLVVAAVNATTARLDWQDNSTGEDKFSIDINTNNSGFVPYASVQQNVTTFTAGGLYSNTYGFRVKAQNASGNSDYSNEATVTLGGSPTPTIPPSTPTATPTATVTPTPTAAPTATATATASASVTPAPILYLHEGDEIIIKVIPKP